MTIQSNSIPSRGYHRPSRMGLSISLKCPLIFLLLSILFLLQSRLTLSEDSLMEEERGAEGKKKRIER